MGIPTLLGALALVAPSTLELDGDVESLAFVETVVAERELYLGQSATVQARFGIDERFFAEHLVQPFHQRLDVPARLFAPWVAGESATVAEAAGGESLALDGDVRRARPAAPLERNGRRFRVWKVETRFEPDAPGTRTLGAPRLTLAWSEVFEESLLGRLPVERRETTWVGDPIELEVLPLPESGRPPEFSGAVGRFTLTADVPADAAPGRPLKLTVRLAGSGNLAGFPTPSWNELGGYRVLGVLDELADDERRFTLDLEPFSDRAWQVPAVSFVVFDPGPPGAYVRLTSESIDLGDGPPPLAENGPEKSGAADVSRPPSSDPSYSSRLPLWIAAAGVALGLTLALVFVLRRT